MIDRCTCFLIECVKNWMPCNVHFFTHLIGCSIEILMVCMVQAYVTFKRGIFPRYYSELCLFIKILFYFRKSGASIFVEPHRLALVALTCKGDRY